MRMPLLSLPEETLLNILSFLKAQDLVAFASVSRYTNNFYKSSSWLQYITELEVAGCLDPSLDAPRISGGALECNDAIHYDSELAGNVINTTARTSISEKLLYLRTRESRWRELDLLRNAKMTPLKRGMEVSVYDLSAGVFAFAENEREKNLHFVELKNVSRCPGLLDKAVGKDENTIVLPRTDVPWQTFCFDTNVADFGLALKEHDLIVFVSYNSKDRGNGALNLPSLQDVKLHLSKFSARTVHPLAKEPVIKLVEKPATYRRPSPIVEVSGKYIVIALTFPRAVVEATVEDLFVINWQTGRMIYHQTYSHPTYGAIAFITPSLFVLPNLVDNTLDLVHIFVGPDDASGVEHVVFLRKLRLPELAHQFKLRNAECRGDPNPTSSTPDILNPKQDMSLESHGISESDRWGAARYGITAAPLRAIISFKFIIVHEAAVIPYGPALNLVMHRSSLASLALDVLEERKISFLSTVSATANSKHHANKSTPLEDVIPVLDWDCSDKVVKWGPSVTRWRLEEDFVDWVTTTAGQRQVIAATLSAGWRPIIIVRDYNPYEVRRMKAKALASKGRKAKGGKNVEDQPVGRTGKTTEKAENGVGLDTGDRTSDTEQIEVSVDSWDGENRDGECGSDSEDSDLDGFMLGGGDEENADGNVGLSPMLMSLQALAHETEEWFNATTETPLALTPPGASSSPSNPPWTYAAETFALASGARGARSPSLPDQLRMEEGGGGERGVNGADVSSGSQIEPDGADAEMREFLEKFAITPGPASRLQASPPPQVTDEASTGTDYHPLYEPSSSSAQGHSPRPPQPLKLLAIDIRDTTAAVKVRYYKNKKLRGGLPCVEYTIEGDQDLYTGLIIDEERIVGYLEDKSDSGETDLMTQMTAFSMYP